MNTAIQNSAAPMLTRDDRNGPLTRARLRRTSLVYAIMCLLGLLPLALNLDASWQAAGVGLWFPGGGFLAAGGWTVLLFPLAFILFIVSLIAWLGAGMVIAPPIIWIGSAALAGAMASDHIWAPAPYLVAAAAATYLIRSSRKRAARRAQQLQRREERNAYLPAAIAAVVERAQAHPAAAERELTPKQLASLRYCIDRALQPAGDWTHYNKIDQFQPAAFRYQLNSIGYTLSLAQCFYTPSFHGYMSRAQRSVIENFLHKDSWGYWRWERLWGSLSLNFDPAGEDNIMLTGFYGINLGLYQGNTGDDRYAKPGALPFKLNERITYSHDFNTITNSVVTNMKGGDFYLFPCEPNWIYTPCNFRGLTTIGVHDRIYGTTKMTDMVPAFMAKLDEEFSLADGSILTVISSHTGLAVPMPFGESSRALMMNVFNPREAQKAWAIARHEAVEFVDGKAQIKLTGKGVDFGNYKPSQVANLAGIATAAAEMGDVEVAQAALDKLDEMYPPKIENGVAFYPASNNARATIAQAQIAQRDDWRNAMLKGPAATAFTGPLLAEVVYPDVLVAKACSHGDDLELVLFPGNNGGERQAQSLRIERLQPGRAYTVNTSTGDQNIIADANGAATLAVMLNGRTTVNILPA